MIWWGINLFQPEKIGLQKLPEKRKGQTLKRLGV
jgi:hypothetical protein